MEYHFVNDCLDCEWCASTEEYTRTELSDCTIEHAVETGHDVTGERLRNREDQLAIDQCREQNERERPENGNPEPGRTPGERQRVYWVNDDFLAEFGDGSDGNNDGANDDRGRTEEPSATLTRGDFEAELRQLVRRAYRSGVPIEGCDARFPNSEVPAYTIEIHELRDRP